MHTAAVPPTHSYLENLSIDCFAFLFKTSDTLLIILSMYTRILYNNKIIISLFTRNKMIKTFRS